MNDFDEMPERLEKIDARNYGEWAKGLVSHVNSLIEQFNSAVDVGMKSAIYQTIKKETCPDSMFYFCLVD